MKSVLMKRWWIGCSGFFYKGWREKFYPKSLPQRLWLEYYCEHFNTVEINVTFYRYPKLLELRDWYRRCPDNFRFTVKAPRLVTHYKRFHDAKRQTMDFYEVVRKGLDDKLGAVLFQLHPQTAYSEDVLVRIFNTLEKSFTNVIEFRHPSWWQTKVMEALSEENITFCGISHPDLPDQTVKTSPVVYYRFHGVPQLYLSSYSALKLRAIGKSLSAYRKVEDVYCYFNNDIEVAAVANAKALQKIIARNASHANNRE